MEHKIGNNKNQEDRKKEGKDELDWGFFCYQKRKNIWVSLFIHSKYIYVHHKAHPFSISEGIINKPNPSWFFFLVNLHRHNTSSILFFQSKNNSQRKKYDWNECCFYYVPDREK